MAYYFRESTDGDTLNGDVPNTENILGDDFKSEIEFCFRRTPQWYTRINTLTLDVFVHMASDCGNWCTVDQLFICYLFLNTMYLMPHEMCTEYCCDLGFLLLYHEIPVIRVIYLPKYS